MVENIEKSVLRLILPGQFLNIVDNQDVEHLIEMNEVVQFPLQRGVLELRLEFVHRHVQHLHLRLALLDFHADRLRDMRFSQPRISVNI